MCDKIEAKNPALEFLEKACTLFYRVAETEVMMRCPHCSHDIGELWQTLYAITDDKGDAISSPSPVLYDPGDNSHVTLTWMQCHNKKCNRLIIKVSIQCLQDERWQNIEEYFGLPRRTAPRPIDSSIPERYTKDYLEASRILDDSPKASAVLSRKILADLLLEYGRYTNHRIEPRIDAFINDSKNPESLKKNLQYLREIADFGAHTQQETASLAIIEVTHDEAEWTLDVIDRLFDYYIVQENRNAIMRQAFDEKLKKAGRKPLEASGDAKNGKTE